jgi:multidrug/hemolysin transport system permease protein
MIALTKRNILLFFRDKMAVFFSMLAVLIIIGLYLLFLGDAWTGDFPDQEAAAKMMSAWIMAGLIAVSGFTTTLGAYGTLIDDKSFKIEKDFLSAPVKRSHIATGYILSGFIISIIMALVTLLIAEGFIVLKGGELLSPAAMLKMVGLIFLSSFMSVPIIQLLVTFIKTSSTFSAFSSIIGTLIGFLTGIYIPIGQLPSGVQHLIRLFPVSHVASLARQIMMEKPLQDVFSGAPTPQLRADMETFLGVTYTIGGHQITPLMSIVYIILTGIVFFIIDILLISKRKHKKTSAFLRQSNF